jgi:predicted dehydrogenase
MKQWRVGIVGLSRGKGFVSVFSAHPQVKVTALCDLDERRLSETGQAFGLADSGLFTSFDGFVSAEFDIAVIATPIAFHAEQTVKCVESGKHVLCEQTVAYTLPECEQVLDAVRRSGKAYMMAENYCYFHYVREWKKLVDAGKLGRIYYAEGEYIHEIIDLLVDEKTGRFYWRHERPPIWYCAHTLGPVLMLMNDRIVRACGLTTGFNKMPRYSDHPGFLDIEVGLFQTQKGAIVKILRSQVASRPHMVWYSLYGTDGHLENQRDRGEGLYYSRRDMGGYAEAASIPCITSDPNAPEQAGGGGHGTSEYYMIRDFLDALEKGMRPPIDAVRAMDFTVPGILAHESAMRGGAWIDVPLFGW